MKILFQARHNLDQFGGGDRIQLLKTKAALERLGHTVDVQTCYVHDLSDYNVIHLFNMQMDTPSLFVYMLNAKRQNKPVALSTIYWNLNEWSRHNPQPPINLLTRVKISLRYPFPGVPSSRLFQFLATNNELRSWLRLFITKPASGSGREYLKRCLIANVDIILPNGESESVLVQKDYGKAKQSLFVPNGVENEFHSINPDAFKRKYKLNDFILSVGRVESRKNVVALAQAATKLKLPLVIIGNLQSEPEYTSKVKAAAPDVHFLSEMPHEELGSAYAAAKVHAMVSWFETPGLSSLEAGLAGCNIVTTDRGTVREYFDDMAWYCDPTNQSSIEKALKSAFSAPKTDKLKNYLEANFSWEKVGQATQKGYTIISQGQETT